MTALPNWAQQLDLQPHPEGGWYRETWRSDVVIPRAALPADYPGDRFAGTAILFLLMPGQESAWHTVRGTEIWLHHRGGPIVLGLGGDDATSSLTSEHLLGPDITAGQQPQLLVPARHWQRARAVGTEPSLVSCIVVPGFDFADFALEEPN